MSFLDLIGPMARGTVEVLFNSLLAGMALTALIWGLLRLVRRINATTRYVVWYVTLLAVICLPLFIFISQVPSETGRTPLNAPVSVEVPSAPIPRAQETLPPRLQEASDLTGDTTLSTPVATEAQDAPQPARLRWRSPVWRFPEQGVLFVFGAWLFGAVSLMARLLWSYAHLGRLKQTSSPLLRTDQLQLQQWMTAFGVRRRVHLHSSPEIAVPMTVGLINPVILLPESFLTQLTETELDQVVLHELAHLQRWDDWSNMVQKLIQVAFFFHPAIMWIGRRLHLEREVACDDWVTAKLGGDSRSYATCLIKLVELALHQQQPLLEIESGTMMAKTQIQRRITRLLDKQRTITARVSKVRLLTTLGGLIAGVVLFAQVTPVIAVFVSPPEPPDTTVSQVNQTGEDTGKIQEINEFIEALQDEDWRVRLSAARTLREMGPKAKDAVPALIEALGDARAPVRSLAVTALRAIGSDAVPALVEALQDKEVREFAVEALGRISPADTQEVIPVLVKVLHNGNWRVRLAATEALGEIGPVTQEVVPALIEALQQDEDGDVRWYAALALGRIGPDAQEAVSALTEVLGEEEENWRVRKTAAWALGEMGPGARDAVPALIKALQDDVDDMRWHAAVALGKIGPDARDAIPALTEALQDKDPYVRKKAADALEKIQSQVD